MSKILVDADEYFNIKNKLNEVLEINKSLKKKYVQLQKRSSIDVGCSLEKFDKLKNENISLKKDITLLKQENNEFKKAKSNFLQDITLFKQKNEELVEENKNLSNMIEEFENYKKRNDLNYINKDAYKAFSINSFNDEYEKFIKEIKTNGTKTCTKEYANEKAIISLTTWTKRIDGVSKTLYSLIKNCPEFHIVLVLSKEEFPEYESLPESVKLLVNYGYIELLWVDKNYKAFKKVLFTLDKYKTVPVISADDDCIYMYNYAEELYDVWTRHKTSFITFNISRHSQKYVETWGFATLHPPYAYKELGLKYLDKLDIERNKCTQDDMFYSVLRVKTKNTKIINLNTPLYKIAYLHDIENSLFNIRKQLKNGEREFRTYLNLMNLND